ncbi:hypothetical protein F4810DRAFT_234818 [Camillea tinctor]|nr:hypothetical protein F4810DRAFT_234818 [Camillea tinctor]
MASNNKFRVVVVGGGPTGLTTAHALSKAGIDFVVLERRESIVEDLGASLVISPDSLRALSQLGLLERLSSISTGFRTLKTATLEGIQYGTSNALATLEESAGALLRIFHRAQLVETLYDELDDQAKARVFTNKKVVDIRSDEKGASVRCADGTVYDGSIVIGADGAHSCVRKSMRQLALKKSPTADVDPEQPWSYEYRMIFFTFPKIPELEAGSSIEAHGSDVSVQLLIADNRAWMFVYERMENPPTERVFYTQEDIGAYAAKWGHLSLTPTFKVRDAFAQRYNAGMVNLEEGMLKHYHWGRLVLVGDSAHKVTPNAGRGLNNGIQDSVALVNEIQRLLTSEGGAKAQPNLDALDVAFERYQKTRQQMFKTDLEFSGRTTRMSAWKTWFLWFVDRWFMPMLPAWAETIMVGQMLAKRMGQGLVFEFLKGEEPFQGKVPWTHPIMKKEV